MMGILATMSKRRLVGVTLIVLRSTPHVVAQSGPKRWASSPDKSIAVNRIHSVLQEHATGTAPAPPQDDTASLSQRLCRDYAFLPPLKTTVDEQQPRGQVLELLASDLGTHHETIRAAALNYTSYTSSSSDDDESDTRQHYQTLEQEVREACTPHYEQLFDEILSNDAQRGLRFLVQLRQDLLQYKRLQQSHALQKRLSQLNTSLHALLSTWFSSETLEIRRITYEHTSASILELIATKEAVHPIHSLDDLRTRLGPDKRVYCAFHPWLSEEPLIFVHVALRHEIPQGMSQVLNVDDDATPPTVACFYSISATQPGLAGVELGHVLLKKAMQRLQQDKPDLKTFCTLSPLPRFRSWLIDKLRHQQQEQQGGGTFVDDDFLTPDDAALLKSVLKCNDSDGTAMLLQHLLSDSWSFMEDSQNDPLAPLILKWAARYLLVEKHRTKPLDGVARFHIPNGSIVHRLNYNADLSRKGIHQSLGVMVNYHYQLETLEENRRAHAVDPTSIPVEDQVKQLLLEVED